MLVPVWLFSYFGGMAIPNSIAQERKVRLKLQEDIVERSRDLGGNPSFISWASVASSIEWHRPARIVMHIRDGICQVPAWPTAGAHGMGTLIMRNVK